MLALQHKIPAIKQFLDRQYPCAQKNEQGWSCHWNCRWHYVNFPV